MPVALPAHWILAGAKMPHRVLFCLLAAFLPSTAAFAGPPQRPLLKIGAARPSLENYWKFLNFLDVSNISCIFGSFRMFSAVLRCF